MTKLRLLVRPTFFLAFLTTASVSPAVLAGDAALAEQLFREGRELLDAGNYAAACPKLKESHAQEPATGTLLALALCEEASGKTASAWASFGEAAARAKREGRSDREQAAREHQNALEAKLSRLVVDVDPSTAALPGVSITRDGAPLGSAAWGSASPVDPGQHVVAASAPGKQTWEGKIMVGGSADKQTLKVPALADAAVAPGATTGARGPDAGAATVEAGSGTPLRTLGFVAGGVGVVGIGLGSYFGLRAGALLDESNADNHCDEKNFCDEDGGRKREDAGSAATLSTVAFIAGGVFLAAGVTLVIVGGPKSADAALRLTPAVAERGGGFELAGRF